MRRLALVLGVTACGPPEPQGPCGGAPSLVVGHEDVDFVPYAGDVKVPENWNAAPPTCGEIGSVAAAQGFFTISLSASTTVRGAANLDGPLVGNLWASVYRHSDLADLEQKLAAAR